MAENNELGAKPYPVTVTVEATFPLVGLRLMVMVLKFAVIVPAAPMVAVVDLDVALAKVIEPVLLVH